MSGFFNFLSGPIGGILTGGLVPLLAGALGGGGGGGQQQQQQFTPPPAPTPTPPAPDRSDATVIGMADRQRRMYGTAGGRTVNALTGGLGVPSGSTYSSVAALLGSVGR